MCDTKKEEEDHIRRTFSQASSLGVRPCHFYTSPLNYERFSGLIDKVCEELRMPLILSENHGEGYSLSSHLIGEA